MAIAVLSSAITSTIRRLWLLSFLSFFLSPSSLRDAQASKLNILDWSCKHATNNTYTSNLENLLNLMLYAEGGSPRYYKKTDGADPDKVYGLYLCRGDVTDQTCQSCRSEVIESPVSIICQGIRSRIAWNDKCLVIFSDKSLSSAILPAITSSNKVNLNVSDPVSLRKALNQSFSQLITRATSSELKFATNIVNVSSSVTLYTLGQCIPDMSKEECRVCLDKAAQLLEYKKLGSTYICPSCNTRFELYPFFSDSSVAAPEPVSPVQAPLLVPKKTGGAADLGMRNRKENRAWIPITVSVSATISVSAVIVVVLIGSFLWYMRRRNKREKEEKPNSQEVRLIRLREGRIGNDYSYDAFQGENQVDSQELHLFPLDLTLEATRHFSDENKLGEGGFGPVYKGIVADGKEIAVKRLSKTSGQGLREFKNEVTVIARLQHKNLVRLLGCCLEGNELLLIYEFMPNKSLDVLLFDSTRSVQLDWKTRLNIINGIARGLLYLHEDSRLKIIHRDLKASNVLLDHEMNPKISDFGMARIFGGNQNEANTNRVVGTYGYMAPEYAMEGLFSVKSDVFSFGVLLLEIISGKKNCGFYLLEHGLSLLNYAWKLWCEEQAKELMDPVLVQSCVEVEVLKYIHIGLLCVQEDPADRPTMSSVVAMLVTDNIKLAQPTQPAFSVGRASATRAGQCSSDVKICSNEVTVTLSDVFPR